MAGRGNSLCSIVFGFRSTAARTVFAMRILSATMDVAAGLLRSLREPPSRGFWHIRDLPGKAREA